MKFYSEVLKRNFNSVKELLAAEKTATSNASKTNSEEGDQKEKPVSNRKQAASKVEAAFEKAADIKKNNRDKQKQLDDQLRGINEKYANLYKELFEKYKEEEFKLKQQMSKEKEVLQKQNEELDEEYRKVIEEAYSTLNDFCKKYGTYHYSVGSNDADIFPILHGFGLVEDDNSGFNALINELFNLASF